MSTISTIGATRTIRTIKITEILKTICFNKSSIRLTQIFFSLLILGFLIPLAGCGDSKEEMGRYVEEVIELGTSVNIIGIAQDDTMIRLITDDGRDLISVDEGAVFSEAEAIRYANLEYIAMNQAGAPDGSRIFAQLDGQWHWRMLTGESTLLELTIPAGEYFWPKHYYSCGCFYMSSGAEIYQIDPAAGEVTFLLDGAGIPYYIASDGKLLYICGNYGVLLYDLENDTVAEKQDETLSVFVTARDLFTGSEETGFSILLYPYEDGVYVLTLEGLYRHTLYGEGMELLIDGNTCGIGNNERRFAGMAVTAENETFLIAYTDGTLARYTFDETLPSNPENALRIYSVYEDCDIRRAIGNFRQAHPEIYVSYEVGISSDSGITLEDALKNLSTEMAAGTGPDILVMDDIPYRSYVEKGVLMELHDIREGMSEETYFLNVIDGLKEEDGGLYTIPLSFVVPLIAAKGESKDVLNGLESLTALADFLEKERSRTDASLYSFVHDEEALHLLSQSCLGAWMTKDGEFDRAAVTEFLTQAKRIYDLQMVAISEERKNSVWGRPSMLETDHAIKRRFQNITIAQDASDIIDWFPGQPVAAGFLGQDFVELNGVVAYLGGDFSWMPGQVYGTSLPATMLSVNSATKNKEESLLFLEYVLSDDYQGMAVMMGIPVNRSAYLARQVDTRAEARRSEPYCDISVLSVSSGYINVDCYWPAAEQFQKLDDLLDGITGVSFCDNTVYEMVIEWGVKVLNEEYSVENAVDEIMKALEIYLAE